MTFIEAVEFMHEKLETYRAVAAYLGMTENHLNALKMGRKKLPKKTEEYVILKAKALRRG